MTKSGLIRLLHGTRTMRTLGDILRRLVPARSAPVYVHQLQTNATTFGSNPAMGAGASVGDGSDIRTPGPASPATVARRRRRSLRAPQPSVVDGAARSRLLHRPRDVTAAGVPRGDVRDRPWNEGNPARSGARTRRRAQRN